VGDHGWHGRDRAYGDQVGGIKVRSNDGLAAPDRVQEDGEQGEMKEGGSRETAAEERPRARSQIGRATREFGGASRKEGGHGRPFPVPARRRRGVAEGDERETLS
jgi:hypothetical protein